VWLLMSHDIILRSTDRSGEIGRAL
jgi:hypothetical protein